MSARYATAVVSARDLSNIPTMHSFRLASLGNASTTSNASATSALKRACASYQYHYPPMPVYLMNVARSTSAMYGAEQRVA